MNTTTEHHIADTGDMVEMEQALEQISQLAPQSKEAAEEVANILADWYLGAVEHGDEAFADAIVVIASRANQLSDTVEHQSAFITALVEMSNELAVQRDDAMQELGSLDNGIEAIKRNHFPAHPKLNNLYDGMAESHNAAFWESLPYDFANMLGYPWEYYHADDLYMALTVDLEEVGEDEHGYTAEELQAFRDQLLIMIKQLNRRD